MENKEQNNITYDDVCKVILKSDVKSSYFENKYKRFTDKIITLGKLYDVAAYLNGFEWEYNNKNCYDRVYFFYVDGRDKKLKIESVVNDMCRCNKIYFNSCENAKRAIEILGEEEIKNALL